tara:strand:- start:188167 stop:188325 length:159 start_codon:yes stop_codon:yes gene_type:complete
MGFNVAIKFEEYTAEFSFDSAEEREEFIQVTREMHPEMEIICTESKKTAASA